jgi:hypothetical protein
VRGLQRAATLSVLVLVASCSPKWVPSILPPESVTGATSLLPPAAYILALDSLVAGTHSETRPTFVSGSPPITRRDLERRHLQPRDDLSVCPGEVALWFLPAEERNDGTIELEVVQAFGNRGLAGSRVFVFRCSTGLCRLVQAVPGSGDRLVLCGRHKP